MTTRETAYQLATAAKRFPFLGISDGEDLLEVVRSELGHDAILDDFQPYGGHRAMAIGPGTLLHIISGNTPHAGLQSVIRGLLLKAHNLCKIPSAGLPQIAQFRDALPDELAARIEITSQLPDEWLARSDGVIVFGNDETLAHIRSSVRPDQRFIAHGHKISLGLVFHDPNLETVGAAARDASLFDQQGCLSPHAFYVNPPQARAYAEGLAVQMESFNRQTPRSRVSPEEAASINESRQIHEFQSANNPAAAVWKSEGSTDWTVIYDPNPAFIASCLNRVIFVKPLPANLAGVLSSVRAHLSTLAIWPLTTGNAKIAASLGATRICSVGRMQSPPSTWHQDGGQTLAPLVTWVDLEG